MLIFNGKEMPSKYTVTDDMILVVNSNNTLEEIYEAIVFGGDISEMIQVDAYKNGDGKVKLESDNMPDKVVMEGVEIDAPTLARSLSLETLEETISGKINERNPMFKAFESYTYGNTTEGYDIKPVNFNKTKPQHIEVLRKHIALARGAMPTLYDEKDESGRFKFKNLSRMRKLSMDGDNLIRYFGPGSISKKNALPTLEEINDFQLLSEYEKRLITNSYSIYHPALLMKLKKGLTEATNSRGAVLTSDLIEEAAKSGFFNPDTLGRFDFDKNRLSLLENSDVKELLTLYRESFKTQIGRPPQILAEYVCGIVSAEGIDSARRNVAKYTTKEYFNLKTMQTNIQSVNIEGYEKPFVTTVAGTRNPGFIYLANKLAAQNYPQQLMRYLSCYVNSSNIRDLLDIGFDKWIEKNKNVKMPDLDCLFTDFSVVNKMKSKGIKLDESKTLKDNCFEIFNERALRDMRGYEEKYHYHFADNETAIKGRHICVTEGKNKMYMLSDDDIRHFTVAYTENTHCCQGFGGAGESCVAKYTSDPFASCVIIEDETGQIQAQGFVWVDLVNDCFVFDNIEYHRDPRAKEYTNLILAYCKELPYKNVQIGMGYVESSGSAWGGVGLPINKVKNAPKASMPTTLNNNHVYSDYHSGGNYSPARIIKNNGELVNCSVNYDRIRIDKSEDEPSRWDVIADGPLKFIANKYDLNIEERIEYAHNFLDNPTVEAQKEVFKTAPQAILMIDNPAVECQVEMYKNHPDIAMQIENPCVELQSLIIADHPDYISNIENPTVELVNGILSKKGLLLDKINNPTEEMCLIAVRQDGYALSKVPEELKTRAVIEAAINQAPKVASLYTDQSPDIQAMATRLYPDVVLMFKQPTIQAKMIAINRKPNLVLQMKDVEEPVVRAAIERSPSLISKYQFGFPELRMTAIEANPTVIRELKDITMTEYSRAVELNPEVTRIVPSPMVGNRGVNLGNDLDDLEIG